MLDLSRPGVAPALAAQLAQIEHGFRRLQALMGDLPQSALDCRGPDGTLNSIAMLVRRPPTAPMRMRRGKRRQALRSIEAVPEEACSAMRPPSSSAPSPRW